MGNGIYGLQRPPANDDPEHQPYIQAYKAFGGWQSQCVFWDGDHWDVWDTGGGPYGYEDDARKDASAWAAAWGFACRLPETPPDPERAPSVLEQPGMLEAAHRGQLFLTCADGESRRPPERIDGEDDDTYRARLLDFCQEGYAHGA